MIQRVNPSAAGMYNFLAYRNGLAAAHGRQERNFIAVRKCIFALRNPFVDSNSY